ncbi:MAG: DUF4255 domain-containing protein [Nostoc sp. SerVER01]|nr:DUF4255 domain-containing protein [Nostoc sp. SerVER01]
MIEHVLSFLKEQLNSYIRVKTGAQDFEVLFVQERNQKEVSFQNDAITTLLVNLEEDYTFRSGAAYERIPNQGGNPPKNPNIYLNLYVLFAANFTDYTQSLQFLSLIIKFFQSHRLFNHHNSPTLNSEIAKLTLELVNLSFTEQREVWAGLGMSYMPSAIYKVRMVVFTDADTVEVGSDITEKVVLTSNI